MDFLKQNIEKEKVLIYNKRAWLLSEHNSYSRRLGLAVWGVSPDYTSSPDLTGLCFSSGYSRSLV
jgi:hypothetical protein